MKILLVGASGQMGKVVTSVAKNINANSNPIEKIEFVCLDKNLPISKFDEVKEPVDVVLDFSSPEVLKEEVKFCKNNKVPLVCATTGHKKENMKLFDELAKDVAVLQSGNFSVGVSVMKMAVKMLTKYLPNFDIELIESHHRNKQDVPSGTCKMLLQTITQTRNENLHTVFRNNNSSKRENNEIGIHSIRGGGTVGEHSVLFLGENESIEIKHIAQNRSIFAYGALQACKWIIGKEKNRYFMEDFIQLTAK